MNVTRIGLDLAKQVFQVHGVSAQSSQLKKKGFQIGLGCHRMCTVSS